MARDYGRPTGIIEQSGDTTLRLVAWNVCGGGGKRIASIARVLGSLSPDVVVLSEVTPKRLGAWREALASVGLAHHGHAVEATSDADPYTVLVASASAQMPHPWAQPAPYPNRAVRVFVDGISVAGIHAPDGISTAKTFYDWLVPASNSALQATSLMAGDFNADESGASMPLNRFFLPLRQAGWVHATRTFAPRQDHASWWGRANAFALDHCLVSPQLESRIASAEILAEIDGVRTAGRGFRVRDGALSDHRPLLVAFRPPG